MAKRVFERCTWMLEHYCIVDIMPVGFVCHVLHNINSPAIEANLYTEEDPHLQVAVSTTPTRWNILARVAGHFLCTNEVESEVRPSIANPPKEKPFHATRSHGDKLDVHNRSILSAVDMAMRIMDVNRSRLMTPGSACFKLATRLLHFMIKIGVGDDGLHRIMQAMEYVVLEETKRFVAPGEKDLAGFASERRDLRGLGDYLAQIKRKQPCLFGNRSLFADICEKRLRLLKVYYHGRSGYESTQVYKMDPSYYEDATRVVGLFGEQSVVLVGHILTG
jgi:hypothetical protein